MHNTTKSIASALAIATEARTIAIDAKNTAISALDTANQAIACANEAKTSCEGITARMEALETENKQLKDNQLRAELYSRRNNIKFVGVAESENENTREKNQKYPKFNGG